MVLVAEALARDLLGRHEGQGYDVVPEAACRGTGLGVDLHLGIRQDALPLGLRLVHELGSWRSPSLRPCSRSLSASLRASVSRVL